MASCKDVKFRFERKLSFTVECVVQLSTAHGSDKLCL